MARSLYVLAGTPGVGKSTIGERVAGSLGLRALEVRELAGGRIEVDVRTLSSRARQEIRRSERDVLLITHIVFRVPDVTVRRVVVLRRDPLEVYEVLRARGYEASKVIENVEAELIGLIHAEAVSVFGRRRVSQVDMTDRSVEEISEKVMRCLESGCDSDEVDWIERFERDGRIEKLLNVLTKRSDTR
ncbi:MAG: AAA family ATPase [Aigarchaeota archaeon]|nr:AAA family ATPase [Aigarchaeota archaeon]MDW8093202.1 AAA family ATPase [Nitrososphaerota archaeon]